MSSIAAIKVSKGIKRCGSRELDALMTLAQGSKETRKALSRQSVFFFAWYYFGIKLAKQQQRWVQHQLKSKRGLVLAPCGHGKSEVFSKILVIWLICQNRNNRILLCSKSDGLARKNLKVARQELESNSKLISDYGRFYDPDNTWSDHQIYCLNRKSGMKDPTVEAIGLLGSITGGRFDIIVLDDVIDILNVKTEDQREKIRDYIDGTLIPRLEPWGVCWAIGTRKHFDDYYARKIKDPVWRVVQEKAIIREPECWHLEELDEPEMITDVFGNEIEVSVKAIIDAGDPGEVLWPEKWIMEDLLVQRYSIGTVVFNREYQNTISSDEGALFQIQWLQQCCDEKFSYTSGDLTAYDREDYIAVIQGIDPSLVTDKKIAESRNTDYSVILTYGIRKNKHRDLIGLTRVRGLSPAQREDLMEDEYYRFLPNLAFLETNSFGTIHAHNLIHDKGLKIVKHHTDGSKDDLYKGVPSLSVMFENKLIRLPYKTLEDKKKTDRLITEFHYLGMEKHDDIVMAAWIAETGTLRWMKGVKRSVINRDLTRVESVRR